MIVRLVLFFLVFLGFFGAFYYLIFRTDFFTPKVVKTLALTGLIGFLSFLSALITMGAGSFIEQVFH